MIALFDKTKNIKWFVTHEGKFFSRKIINGKEVCLKTKKATIHKRGYVYVRTTNGNYQVHRLVASAFIPNPENKPCVNHKDFNKQNNHISNLEWVTYQENYDHAKKYGRINHLKKNESGALKYTNEQCRDVLLRIKSGMNYKKAGELYNMPYSTVAHLARKSRRDIII